MTRGTEADEACRVKSMISLLSFPASLNKRPAASRTHGAYVFELVCQEATSLRRLRWYHAVRSPSYIDKGEISSLKLTRMPLSLAELVNGQIFGPNLPSEESHIIADNRIHPI